MVGPLRADKGGTVHPEYPRRNAMSTQVELVPALCETDLESESGRQVFAWRLEQLLRAGYGDTAAVAIALHSEIDLHAATDLVGRGCPPETAARILL